ncbi:hypothetical protein EsVE80_08010 [Enterococcus saigonensis]|uniref:N-acetyltransferase domain-containing protein n=1 Tax=Enterococcus saigonensis TaxID=1805431 RepID=A0A679I6S4_9ENTE|nr:GNAT family N-acetyltransferase [Enterococcus saigonensis]BCA85278.1 hypothetical protein EsVE80_08010 [Enterococcus saigonensis]
MTEKIRIATKKDAAAILAIYMPYVKETAITFEYEVPTLADFEKRIEQTLARYPYLVAEKEDSTLTGYAYAGAYKGRPAYDWSCEVTIYVAKDAKSRGLGTRLYQALEVELQKQNVVQLLACITAGNGASIKFHEKLGYRQVGIFPKLGYKFAQWYDILWLQKTLQEVSSEPDNFIPYPKIKDLP